MPLSEEEQLVQMAEVLFVERMGLSPEVHTTLSVLLECRRWFSVFCSKESVSFSDITPELLIQRLAGRPVQVADIVAVREEIQKRLEGGLLPDADAPTLVPQAKPR